MTEQHEDLLVAIAGILTSDADLAESLRRVCRELARFSGADTVSVHLLDADGRSLVPTAAYRVPKEILPALVAERLPLDEQGFRERVYAEGDVAWSDDVQGDDRFAFPLFRRFPHQSGAIIPLLLDTGVAGSFYLVWWHERRRFDEPDLVRLRAVGRLVALLLRNAALLRASVAAEERYRSLFEHVPVGVLRTTPEGAILEANPAMVAMLGYPDLPALQAVRTPSLYWNPEDRDRFRRAIRGAGVVRNLDIALRRHDGAQIWVRMNTRSVEHGVEIQYEGVLQDVSDLRRAEEAERQAAGLLSVMRLANAAAHEINNPLSVVLGRLEMLRRGAADDATVRQFDQAMEAARRVAEIVAYMGRIARLETNDTAGSPMLDIRKSAAEPPAKPPEGPAAT
jgi:PAS domain S-box-containing protein